MRRILGVLVFAFASTSFAASIPKLDFPVKNGSAGEMFKMSDFPNDVFVFEAYRLFCGYCNDNAPAVDRLAEDYKDNARVHVLDLGLDTQESEFQQWISKHQPNHPVIQDVGKKAYNALRVQNGIPQVFIVNCRGERVGAVVGAWDSSAAKRVRGYVDTALQTTCE